MFQPLYTRKFVAAGIVTLLLSFFNILWSASLFSVTNNIVDFQHANEKDISIYKHNTRILQATHDILSPTNNDNNHTIRDSTRKNEKALLSIQKVFDDYQQWHSVESLQRYPHNRSFIIGYYYCPQQAGNRLHDFFHNVIVAIVLNRTLLWKYYDIDTCRTVSKGYKDLICQNANTVHDCQEVVTRASWVPSFDEWKHSLNLTDMESLRPRGTERLPIDTGHSRFKQEVLVTYQMVTQTTKGLLQRQGYLSTSEAKRRANKLFSNGISFLHGMLFNEIFPIRSELAVSPTISHTESSETQRTDQAILHDIGHNGVMNDSDNNAITTTISFAIHSRHWNAKMKPTNIDNEINCFKKLFQPYNESSTNCTVYVMSDRPKTTKLIQQYIDSSANNCKAVSLKSYVNSTKRSTYGEHGPHAGIGFYQELAMARQARHGFVGHCDRSSSQLLMELVTFDRQMEILTSNRGKVNYPPLQTCCLSST